MLRDIQLIEVQRKLYGEERANRRCTALSGAFGKSFGQLYERVEEVCFVTEKYPRSFISKQALLKLRICRLRCVTSGMLVGIGCSFGAETQDAYRMALLCASMDKVLYCALFNLHITHAQWPARGLSPYRVDDRRRAGDESRSRIERLAKELDAAVQRSTRLDAEAATVRAMLAQFAADAGSQGTPRKSGHRGSID